MASLPSYNSTTLTSFSVFPLVPTTTTSSNGTQDVFSSNNGNVSSNNSISNSSANNNNIAKDSSNITETMQFLASSMEQVMENQHLIIQ